MNNEDLKELIFINSKSNKGFFKSILLYEINEFDNEYTKVFVSERQKNGIPRIINLGDFKNGRIISDSLTVLLSNDESLLIGLIGDFKYLIKTVIKVKDCKIESLKIYGEIYKNLNTKEVVSFGKLLIKKTKDVFNEIDGYSKKVIEGKTLKTKTPPKVYLTWSYYGEKVNKNDVAENLEAIKARNVPVDVFQIDDGWEKCYGEWETNSKFDSLESISKTISSYGLTPGIWIAPFIAKKESKIFKEHPDWILKNKLGLPCVFRVNKGKYYIFDITIEETHKYFEELFKDLKNMGFGYFKVDFTRAPILKKHASFKNKTIGIVEAYINAIKSIRNGIGDSFLNICGGLFEPVIGLADSVRTGSDIFSMWKLNDKKTFEKIFRQNIYRFYMNNYWYNDPDTLSIRRNINGDQLSLGILDDEEVKTVVLNQILSCGIKTISEPLFNIDDGRLYYFNYIISLNIEKIEIVDFESDTLKEFNLYSNDDKYKAYINWTEKEIKVEENTLKRHSSIIIQK